MKPQLGLSKCLDSSHSLRDFSLKKYKHLSKLRVVKLPNPKFEQNPKRMSILLKLSVSVKSLDLSQYGLLEKYSRSKIKLVAKKFSKITGFSPFKSKKGSKGFLLTKIMLKKAKNLRHLFLKAVFDDSLSHHLFHLVSQNKLETLDLISLSSPQYKSVWLLNYLNYLPPSVEELCFSLREQMRDGSILDLSINHLENLQKLELGMLLSIETFTKIIKSIYDSSKLKVLRFHLKKCQNDGSYLPEIQAFLGSCLNLEELSIQTDMDVHPSHVRLMKLQKLSIESTEGLLRIMHFIQQQKDSLESLSLTSKLWNIDLVGGFLEGLKSLERLKKLRLNLKSDGCVMKALALVELIEALEYLEEVDFLDLLVEFKEDSFERFCKALQKRSSSLRSLKLSFNKFSMDQKSLSLFIQTLNSLSRLEHVTFKDFGIEDAGFYSELRELVCCRNKELNEVILERVKRNNINIYSDNLIKMLKDIIHKPTMRRLCYLEEEVKPEFALDFKDLEVLSLFDDILKEVHHFDYLRLLSYTCQPTFYYWDLDLHKWSS